jgi:HD-GYP domain-containing protein (c-di-GMP phosphodiesterase class II)
MKTKIFSNYLNALKSDPIFIVLDSLYYRNPDAGIYEGATAKIRYNRLLDDLGRILSTDFKSAPPQSIRSFPFSGVFSLAEMILFSVVNRQDILSEVMRPTYKNDCFLQHTINVAFLCCQTVIGLGLSYKELTQACVVALLHDVGMKFIDPQAYNHDGQLSASQRREVDRHFEESYRYFKHIESDIPFLLRAVSEENDRLKSGGNKPTEEDNAQNGEMNGWHTYAEVVSMCNKIEALCHDRPFRKPYHPADAMRIFVEENKQKFERRFIRAIIDSISLFPVTSMVKLNNNRIARVVDIVEGSPLSPIVGIVAGNGEDIDEDPELTGEVIDLSQKPTVFIDGLVYGKNFTPPKKD